MGGAAFSVRSQSQEIKPTQEEEEELAHKHTSSSASEEGGRTHLGGDSPHCSSDHAIADGDGQPSPLEC